MIPKIINSDFKLQFEVELQHVFWFLEKYFFFAVCSRVVQVENLQGHFFFEKPAFSWNFQLQGRFSVLFREKYLFENIIYRGRKAFLVPWMFFLKKSSFLRNFQLFTPLFLRKTWPIQDPRPVLKSVKEVLSYEIHFIATTWFLISSFLIGLFSDHRSIFL